MNDDEDEDEDAEDDNEEEEEAERATVEEDQFFDAPLSLIGEWRQARVRGFKDEDVVVCFPDGRRGGFELFRPEKNRGKENYFFAPTAMGRTEETELSFLKSLPAADSEKRKSDLDVLVMVPKLRVRRAVTSYLLIVGDSRGGLS